MKYLGKTALYNRMQGLSKQIGCKIPKMEECLYSKNRGTEWLNFEYQELDEYGNDSRVEVEAVIFKCAVEARCIIRVYVDEYIYDSASMDDDERAAHNLYKFIDDKCNFCSILENPALTNDKWAKRRQAAIAEVGNG